MAKPLRSARVRWSKGLSVTKTIPEFGLLVNPLRAAIALMVSLADTLIGPVYIVDEVVGMLPSVV